VHKAAANGDNASIKILDKSINYLAKCALNMHKKLDCKDVKLGVFGGNFQKSEYFFDEFKRLVYLETDNIKIDLPEFTPVEGALILAGRKIGLDISKNIKNTK